MSDEKPGPFVSFVWGGSSAGTIEGVPPGAGVIPERRLELCPQCGWTPGCGSARNFQQELGHLGNEVGDLRSEVERLRGERDELEAAIRGAVSALDACRDGDCKCPGHGVRDGLVARIKGERG